MQAQAKKKIVSGVKRGSLMIKKAATAARNSIRRTSASLEMLIGKDFIKKNKIEVEANEHRFSVAEITEDEYDPIMVHSSSRKNDSDSDNENEEGEHGEDDSEKDQDLNSEELLIRQIQELKREMHANENKEEDASNIKDDEVSNEKQDVDINADNPEQKSENDIEILGGQQLQEQETNIENTDIKQEEQQTVNTEDNNRNGQVLEDETSNE